MITDLDVGGAEKCVTELALGLDRSRWQPAVCSLMPAGTLVRQLTSRGIPVHCLDVTRYRAAPVAILRLARLIHCTQPDLVHTFLFHANVVGRLASRLACVSRVVSSVRIAERRHRHHLVLENVTSRLAERITCVSQAVGRFTQLRSHVPAPRIVIIPNGVATDSICRASPLNHSALGLPSKAVVAICVARLDRQKGIDVLLKASVRVIESVPEFQLLLVGCGPEEASLQDLASRLGVSSHTRFLGLRDDVPALLRTADFFVLPSRWEGMPNAVLEAMAAGLPVVATSAEGSGELVRDGQTGRAVPIDDISSLASGIIELATDRDKRRRWGGTAQAIVRQEYSLTEMVLRYEQLYESLFETS